MEAHAIGWILIAIIGVIAADMQHAPGQRDELRRRTAAGNHRKRQAFG